MITMQNVRKKYKDFELELSLEIPEGRITGFVGKNGAGKSTLLKTIWHELKGRTDIVVGYMPQDYREIKSSFGSPSEKTREC